GRREVPEAAALLVLHVEEALLGRRAEEAAEPDAVGAVGIEPRERVPELASLEEREEDTRRRSDPVREVLEDPEVEVRPVVLPLPLQMRVEHGIRVGAPRGPGRALRLQLLARRVA